jgi:hypothetical protein
MHNIEVKLWNYSTNCGTLKYNNSGMGLKWEKNLKDNFELISILLGKRIRN